MTDPKILDSVRFLVRRHGRQPLPVSQVEDILLLANDYFKRRWGKYFLDLDNVSFMGDKVGFSTKDLHRNDHIGGLTSDEKRFLGKAMTSVMA